MDRLHLRLVDLDHVPCAGNLDLAGFTGLVLALDFVNLLSTDFFSRRRHDGEIR